MYRWHDLVRISKGFAVMLQCCLASFVETHVPFSENRFTLIKQLLSCCVNVKDVSDCLPSFNRSSASRGLHGFWRQSFPVGLNNGPDCFCDKAFCTCKVSGHSVRKDEKYAALLYCRCDLLWQYLYPIEYHPDRTRRL